MHLNHTWTIVLHLKRLSKTAIFRAISDKRYLTISYPCTGFLWLQPIPQEFRKEKRQLQARRADLLAMGFQNSNEENQAARTAWVGDESKDFSADS